MGLWDYLRKSSKCDVDTLLALKSGNAVVLRSGKDAYQTAHAIVTALKKGLETVHPDVIQWKILTVE